MRWQQPHIEALLDQAIHNVKQPGVRAGEVYAALAFEIRNREKCDVTAVPASFPLLMPPIPCGVQQRCQG